jgi:diguanylate cyclase (GGDEF)-like protein/PAS domain S-box-containing protein
MGSSRRALSVSAGDEAAAVLAAIDIGVLALDDRGRGIYANPAWVELTGQERDGWIGDGWQVLLPGEGQLARFLDDRFDGTVHPVEVPVRSSRGTRLLHLEVVPAPGHARAAAVVTARDVSEERAAEEALARVALHDPLTGLWNRSRFLDFLAQALTRAERDHDRRTAVFFVDVDELKATNDRAGHAAGDRLLQAVAEALCAAVRPGDVVARLGGDEFTVLCDGVDEDDVETIAARMLRAVETSPEAACTVSLGVAVSQGPADDPSEIIARADADMYRAKRGAHQHISSVLPPIMMRLEPVVLGDEAPGFVREMGALARLLSDRWADLGSGQRAEVLGALVRVQADLESAVAARSDE